MFKTLKVNRYGAFLIHLGISLSIFLILLWLIIYRWFPAPYFDMSFRQGWIQLIVFVDIILGPLLTLIVFKPGKPSLKFDMSVIVIVQVVALSWGVWNAWSVHPVSNVYYEGRITCLTPQQYRESGADMALYQEPLTASIVGILPKPTNWDDVQKYMDSAMKGRHPAFDLGKEIQQVTSQIMSSVLKKKNSEDFEKIVSASETGKEEWRKFVAEAGGVRPEWHYLSLSCADNQKTAVYDAKENRIVTVLNIALPVAWIMNN